MSAGAATPRPISDTILDFGEPLLAQLPEPRPADALHNALTIVITVWNAHVMATGAWGRPEHLDELRRLVHAGTAPPAFGRTFELLSQRRAERFADDLRVVGKWSLVPDGPTAHRFRCDARVPSTFTNKP